MGLTKKQEIENQESCWNRARDDEPVFVLLGRDAASSEAVRAWVRVRIAIGKNTPDDSQIKEALARCDRVET